VHAHATGTRRASRRPGTLRASDVWRKDWSVAMQLMINRDATFLISDELGNIPDGADFGLYLADTRFLRRHELTLDAQPPVALGARATGQESAAYFLTNPALPRVPRGVLSIVRRRSIGRGLREELEITNYWREVADFSLGLDFQADFAHVIAVRQGLKAADGPLPGPGVVPRVDSNGRSLHFDGHESGPFTVHLCQRPDVVDGGCRFRLRLAPREEWHVCIDFLAAVDDERECSADTPGCRGARPARTLKRRQAGLVHRAPRLETDSHVLRRAYKRSVQDLAALRIKGEDSSEDDFVIAAGIPWFMALFGRDALIAAYQALPFYPDLAKGVLRALARLQGEQVDPLRREEPGKIIHEHRPDVPDGAQRLIPAFPYYGTVDATPLYLVLLAAVHRVTGDLEFVRSLEENAERALEWLDRYGDRDGDGYLEYLPDEETGLANQGWKDSFDAVQFRDGTLARPPIALCEVQGYAYAARVGMAEVFEALGDPERARGLRADAVALRERFNRDFWLPDREYYALALDAEKRPVDALTSNPGHLLWTGLADEAQARLVARRLASPELFSGWGVRTMATTEAGYNPISYHNGSVWPHDTSLIVTGLARYGFVDEAAQLADGLLAALEQYPDRRLPEVFAGYDRAEAPFPVDHPMASQPQAWAAGSVLLLLTSIVGLDASVSNLRGTPFLPSRVERVRVDGLWAGQQVVVEAARSPDGARP
jgi:glycogen debranching enzyme